MTGDGFSPNDSLNELRDDADDDVLRDRGCQPSSQRFGVGQEPAHELLVDDGLRRRGRIVEGREVLAGAQRDPHRPEIVRRSRCC